MITNTLAELRTGDIVLSTKGSYGIVLRDTPMGGMIRWFRNNRNYNINKFRTFRMINPDFTFKHDEDNRIIKVWRTDNKHYIGVETVPSAKLDSIFVCYGFKLIYEDEVREVTMDEVEKKFGCKVKIKNN